MHRIIQNHLRRFSNLFGYSETEESEQFELFVNYCVTASLAAGRFEPKEVTTGSDDSGIDGVVVVIDDEVVTSKELAEALFQKERRHRDVSLAFTQSKSGDAFTKADILSFGAAVCNFLDDEPCFPRGDLEDTMREVFDVVIANVHKVRGGKPNCHLYFATTGMWPGADEIITGAANKIRADVAASDYFSDVAFTPLGRDSLLRLWTETYEPVEATFQVKGYTPFPAMNGVNQAYMAVVPARSCERSSRMSSMVGTGGWAVVGYTSLSGLGFSISPVMRGMGILYSSGSYVSGQRRMTIEAAFQVKAIRHSRP